MNSRFIECPYEFDVRDMLLVRAHGDALKKAQKGKTSRFEISFKDNYNKTNGDIDVLIHGK